MARNRMKAPGVEVATAEKIALALKMRGDERATYAHIASVLGVSESYARKLVEMGLEQTIAEPAKSARMFELRRMRRAAERIERLSETFDPKELAQLTGALTRVSERIARLQGLDAPTKLDVRERPVSDWSLEELQEALREAKR